MLAQGRLIRQTPVAGRQRLGFRHFFTGQRAELGGRMRMAAVHIQGGGVSCQTNARPSTL